VGVPPSVDQLVRSCFHAESAQVSREKTVWRTGLNGRTMPGEPKRFGEPELFAERRY